MQKEREDCEGEGRNTCPELHHTGKGSSSGIDGAELRHILKNVCSLNIPRPCFCIGPS